MRIVTVNASQRTHTPAGDLIAHMYYGIFLESVLLRSEYAGAPNTGNMHMLHITLPERDLHAFLQIVEEHFKWCFPMEVRDFVSSVLKNLATGNVTVEQM